MSAQLANVLVHGAGELGIRLAPAQVTTLLDFLALLGRWNRAYNLTAVRDPAQMVTRHLLDSLSIAPFVRGNTLLDVGSGAGMPGLALAVALPHLQVTLLDSALKRTRFLVQAVHELGLRNVVVQRARIEDFTPQSRVDTVTSRATLALDTLIDVALPLLSEEGRLVAMLGKVPASGSVSIAAPWQLRIEALAVPGIDAARHAAVISRTHRAAVPALLPPRRQR